MSGLRPIIVGDRSVQDLSPRSRGDQRAPGDRPDPLPGEFVAVVGRSGSGKTTLPERAGRSRQAVRRPGVVRGAGPDGNERGRPDRSQTAQHRIRLPRPSGCCRCCPPSRTSSFRSGYREWLGRAGLAYQGGAGDGRTVAAAGAPPLRALRRRAAARGYRPRRRDASEDRSGRRADGRARLGEREIDLRALQGDDEDEGDSRARGHPRLRLLQMADTVKELRNGALMERAVLGQRYR